MEGIIRSSRTLPVAGFVLAVVGLSHAIKRPDDVRTEPDPIVSSFVFVGGCRVDPSDLDPIGNPSSANIAELRQTLADVAALRPRPDYWFFIGDLVEGLGTAST